MLHRAPIASRRTARVERVLVTVDDSDASIRAVKEAARLFGGREEVTFVVRHLTRPFPPALLETPGAEDPHEEERIEARLRSRQHRTRRAAERRAGRILDRARAALHGIDPARVDADSVMAEAGDLAPQLVHIARSAGCGTMVVGRSAPSRLRRLLHEHLGERLVREGRGLTICVVG